MNENLTILKKGLVLISIPFVAQLVFVGVLLKTNAEGVRAQGWAIHTKEVIAQAEGTFRRLVEAHSDIRGLLLTGDSEFDENAKLAIKEVPIGLDVLRKLVSDNPPQQVKVTTISEIVARLLAWQGETARLFRAGKRDEALARVKGLDGESMLRAIRVGLDDFLREEVRLDSERMANVEKTSNRQAWALAWGGLFTALSVVGLAVVFGREITRRFATLSENALRLAKGKELVRPLSGRDEIAQLDRVFHQMARAIAEKNRENEMFIYSVSHDIRSPLVNLQGFSQELGHSAKEIRGIIETSDLPGPIRDRAISIVDEDINGSIRFIQTAVSRLSAIIDALLRLSRAGRVEYRWETVDVDLKVSRVIEALNSTITERGAKVSAGSLPKAWADPTAVEQIFANLIGNALNYLDPRRPGVIEVGVLDEGPTSDRTYYVKDNGQGIPEAGMAKLFQAFQRFHDGAARGEGIGLALVRRIIERHGGKIRVESEPGVGTTFFVELPTRPPEGGNDVSIHQGFEGRGVFV